MNSVAKSKLEADVQIKNIQSARGFDGKQFTTLALSFGATINILSDQLYQNPSHFLLELIQNADDNKFPVAVTPSLAITLSSTSEYQYLRTDCNEVGFTYEDINAITLSGMSTKNVSVGGQSGYIGEKGIGFKSVFKVADVVHVASGYYQFKFDRHKPPLGMVFPILSAFPSGQRLPNHTQFLLALRSDEDYKKIQNDLLVIEPQLLMFLRNIRTLRVNTNHAKTTHQVRNDTSNTALGEVATIYTRCEGDARDGMMEYVIMRYNAMRMPADERRKDVTTSEVILAFPTQYSKTPEMGTQKVFAFLPIDDFGFKFLIHADFLLVASREALEYALPWNLALRNAIQRAFLMAIKRFAVMPASKPGRGLRYIWPKYIKHHRSSHDFWNQLSRDILCDLRGQEVLESRDPHAGYCQPSELRFVPTTFRFEREALFDCASLRSRQLNFHYDSVYDELELLGVEAMDIQYLGDEFQIWIAEVGISGLRAKPAEWHRQVASIFCNQVELKDDLARLPIIPLRDGSSWVSANTKHLYLEHETGDEYVPSSINLSIVDATVSQDPVMRRFYQFLGIKTYSPMQVCLLILELHAGNTSSVMDRMPEDLVKDAAYLFKHRNLFTPDIYFLVKNQGLSSRRKTQIYIIDYTASPSLIYKYKDTPSNPFYILDELYEKTICAEDQNVQGAFYEWLLQSSEISTIPKLVRSHHLTAEWFFLKQMQVTDLLLVVEQAGKTREIRDRILLPVQQLQVECRDGGARRPLVELAVPTQDLVQACPHISFANLSGAERFRFLKHYGILTSPNTAARLRELDALMSIPVDSVDKDAVHVLYRGLSLSSERDESLISEAFNSKPLVFIARPLPEWVTHQSCVWRAPPSLNQVTRLANRYNDCQRLFCEILGVKSANIQHVADELCFIQEEYSEGIAQRCQDLLMTLRQYLTPESEFTTFHFLRIRYARVFPVLEAGQPIRVVFRALQDADWYIPDTTILDVTFRGKVDLLKFTVQSVQLLDFLFSKLNCRNMYLSSAVEEEVEPRGSIIRDLWKERELGIRLPYISYLNVTPYAQTRRVPQPLRAWSVPSIVIIRRLKSIEIIEDNQLVSFKDGSGFLNIYFRADIPQSKHVEVTFKLAEYFSRQYDVKLEDINLFHLLLGAELENLDSIMASNNRFMPEEEKFTHRSNELRILGEMPAVEQQRSHLRDSEQKEVDNDGITRHPTLMASPGPSAHPPSTQISYYLRDLIPSFQSRSQSIARSARSFRISKHHPARGSDYAQKIGERLQQALDSAPRASLSSTISALTQGTLPTSSVEVVENNESPSQQPMLPNAQQVKTREIGFLGEMFIHTLLQSHINDWSFDNWTSKLRVEGGHPPFREHERGFTDFTYTDNFGHMKAFFQEAGLDLNREWSTNTTYHLEVKTTNGECGQSFFASQNQVKMMQRYNDDPNHAYILLRVFDINGSSPGLKFYPSPWSLGLSHVLEFVSPGGYQICEREQS